MSPAGLAVCISAAALVVSAISATFTAVNVTRGQENLSIKVERDLKAGLEPTRMSITFPDYEAENGLRSHWVVQVSNTSISSPLSMMRVEIEISQFLGYSMLLPDNLDIRNGVKSTCALEGVGTALHFPIKLAAGEAIIAHCDAKISLKHQGAEAFQSGLPSEENGVYMTFGDTDFDMFGNAGETEFDGTFAAIRPETVQQPRLTVRVETARGYLYSGSGSWYTSVSQLVRSRTPAVLH